MTIPSTAPARNDFTADQLAQELLAHRPAVLAASASSAAASRGRPSLTMILVGVVGAAVLFAGGLLVGHATGSSTTAQTGPGAVTAQVITEGVTGFGASGGAAPSGTQK